MMNQHFGQGEGALSRAGGMVTEARTDFDRMAAKLTQQIAGMQGQWSGAGARAFFALHQAWTEKQHAIVSALDEFSNSLGVTERDNVSTDEAQGQSFHRIQNRVG